MPASGKLVSDFNSARAAGKDIVTSFLRERVFSKNTFLHASVPLSKRLTFAKEPGPTKSGEELTATAVEVGRTALKAVTNLFQLQRHTQVEAKEHRVLMQRLST